MLILRKDVTTSLLSPLFAIADMNWIEQQDISENSGENGCHNINRLLLPPIAFCDVVGCDWRIQHLTANLRSNLLRLIVIALQ